jgi:hypothetical protein
MTYDTVEELKELTGVTATIKAMRLVASITPDESGTVIESVEPTFVVLAECAETGQEYDAYIAVRAWLEFCGNTDMARIIGKKIFLAYGPRQGKDWHGRVLWDGTVVPANEGKAYWLKGLETYGEE